MGRRREGPDHQSGAKQVPVKGLLFAKKTVQAMRENEARRQESKEQREKGK